MLQYDLWNAALEIYAKWYAKNTEFMVTIGTFKRDCDKK